MCTNVEVRLDKSTGPAAYSASNSWMARVMRNTLASGIRTNTCKRNKTTTRVEICSLFVQGNVNRGHVREIPCVNPMKCAPFIVLRSPELVVTQHLMSCVLGMREHGGAWMWRNQGLRFRHSAWTMSPARTAPKAKRGRQSGCWCVCLWKSNQHWLGADWSWNQSSSAADHNNKCQQGWQTSWVPSSGTQTQSVS